MMLLLAANPLPEPSRLPAMDGSMLKLLIVVGGAVTAFMLYLVIDWIRARLALRKFEARRRQARAEWQEELREMNEARDSEKNS